MAERDWETAKSFPSKDFEKIAIRIIEVFRSIQKNTMNTFEKSYKGFIKGKNFP